jgi:prepilin-type N-terminal cleavage/methylation domain-containing protein
MKNNKGFTLIENLILVVISGIFAAIAAPSWLSFIRSIEVDRATDRLHWQLQKAKSEAKRDRATWEVLIRQSLDGIQYSVNHDDLQAPVWQTMPFQNAEIDPGNTTFFFDRRKRAYRMQFNWLGVSNGRLGRVTIMHKQSKIKRCVIVSTLLGSMRTGKEKGGRCD